MADNETDPVFMEALEWFARMQDEKLPEAERLRFSRWIAADPAHAAAYSRAEMLWNRFDIIKPEYERLRRGGMTSRRGVVLGAVSLLFAGTGAYLMTQPGALADHTTGIGERRTVSLPDGSTAELGSYSALSVHYTDNERRLVLHRGQAFFSVSADTVRPFVVDAEKGTIRALGTRFDVKLTGQDVTVTVIEHSVLVTSSGSPPVEIGEGWQVSYDVRGVAQPRPVDVAVAQAWRRDRIIFEDVPLRRVLKELERYRRGRIVLMDDGAGDIPVTAVFETAHADAALQVIAGTLPVRVVDAAGFIAIVYRR